MSDLISRQAAIDAIKAYLTFADWKPSVQRILEMSVNDITDMLERLPSAQPEPKKGKWIHDGFNFPQGVDWVHCSVCGRKGINVPADLTNFCPNCGADMREKEE